MSNDPMQGLRLSEEPRTHEESAAWHLEIKRRKKMRTTLARMLARMDGHADTDCTFKYPGMIWSTRTKKPIWQTYLPRAHLLLRKYNWQMEGIE